MNEESSDNAAHVVDNAQIDNDVVKSKLKSLGQDYSCFDNLYFLSDTRVYTKTLYSNQVQVSYNGKNVQVLLLPNIQSVILQKGGTYDVLDSVQTTTSTESSTMKRTGIFKSKVTLERSVFQSKPTNTSLHRTVSLNSRHSLIDADSSSIHSLHTGGKEEKEKSVGFFKRITRLGSLKRDNSTKLASTAENKVSNYSSSFNRQSLMIHTSQSQLPSPSLPSAAGSLSSAGGFLASPPSGSYPLASPLQAVSAISTNFSVDTLRRGPPVVSQATVGLPASWELHCEGWLRLYQTENSASEPLWFKLEQDQMNGYAFKESKQSKMQFPIPNRCVCRTLISNDTVNPVPNFWPFKMHFWKSEEVIVIFVAHTESEMLRWVSHLNTYIINRMSLALMHGIEYNNDGTTTVFKSDPTLYYKKELSSLVSQFNQGILELKPNFEVINLTTMAYDTNVAYSEPSKSLPVARLSLSRPKEDLKSIKISIEEKHVRWAYNMLDEVKNPTKNVNLAIHPSQVIEKLTDDQHGPEEEFVESFLLVYRHWFAPAELLKKLTERYILEAAGKEDAQAEHFLKWRSVIRLRTVAFLKRWIDSCWSDFSKEDAQNALNDFIQMVVSGKLPAAYQTKQLIPEERQARSDLKKVGDLLRIYWDAINEVKKNETKRSEPSPATKGKIEFINILNEKDIADEITLLEFERYKQLQPLEFFIHAWSKKDELESRIELNILLDMIQGFNNLSYWVATEICTQPDLKIRAHIVERMINLAKRFKKLNNFNSLLAVVSGLNTASVQRLKSTWELVDQKYTAIFQDLEEFVNPQNNFKKYRETLSTMENEWVQFWERKLLAKPSSVPSSPTSAISSISEPHMAFTSNQPSNPSNLNATSKNALSTTPELLLPEPAIPVISLFLKDLTFLSDGNPKYYEDSKLFNYGKAKTMFSSVQKILLYQLGKYEGLNPPEDVKEFCKHMRALKENALYKYSQLMESKGDSNQQRLINKWVQGT